MARIQWVGFDGDDTLWKSEDYYRQAEADFEAILAAYIDLADPRTHGHLLEVERRNLKIFGYGVKGMTLSMLETAIQLTDERISARDLHRVIEIGRATLRHPVDLLPGIREAVAQIASDHEIVLITKGDLFHQEQKVPPCRRRASIRKLLNILSSSLRRRRAKGRSCSPLGPNVARNCPSFAPIRGAA